MIGTALKKYAMEMGLTLDRGRAWGLFRGYMTTLEDGLGGKALRVGVHFADQTQQQQVMDWLGQKSKEYKLQSHAPKKGAVEIIFLGYTAQGTVKRMRRFVEEFYDLLIRTGVAGAGTCPYCGQELAPGDLAPALVDGAVQGLHQGCLHRLEEALATANAPMAGPKQKPQSVAKGVLGAVLGGIVGAIPWGLVYALGYFVTWLGLLIGICIKKGYEMAGGKNGVAKMVVVLLLVLPAVILGQLLGECFTVAWMILTGEISWLTLGDIPLVVLLLLLEDAEYRVALIGNIAIGLIFAILGVSGVFRSLRGETKGNAGRVQRLEHLSQAGVPASGIYRASGPEL